MVATAIILFLVISCIWRFTSCDAKAKIGVCGGCAAVSWLLATALAS